MTLDEAIVHAKEVANAKYAEAMLCHANPNDEELDGCIECAKDHEQLAEWLEDYKRLKSIHEHTYDNCHNITCRRRCEKDGYDKAIDEFAERLRLDCLDSSYHETHMFHILKVAEQLKEGDDL